MEDVRNTPYDYSDEQVWVSFELPNISKPLAFDAMEELNLIKMETLRDKDNGFEILICNQQIPEIVRAISNKNIAIYQVIRLN